MSDNTINNLTELPIGSGAGQAGGDELLNRQIMMPLLEAMPGGAAFLDPDLIYLYANRQFLDFFGLLPENLIGKHASDIYPPDGYAKIRPIADRVFSGETVKLEGPSFYRGGDSFVRQSFTPFKNRKNEILGMIVLGFDLTDLKRQERLAAENAAQQAEAAAVHKAIVKTSLDCIIILDENSCVVEFNPAAEKLFGYSGSDVIGKDVADLIIPEKFRNAHHDGMKRYIASGKSRVIGKRVELEAISADGSLIPVELAIAEVTVGGTRLFTAHIRDLSGAKAQLREIERQRDILYQKEKLAALGSMLSGVAHELNNPLSVVIGQTMMLRERASAGHLASSELEDLVERSVKIEAAANRCAKIVRNFLAMARQNKATRRQVDILKIIDEAVDLLGYGLKASDVKLQVTASGKPPLLYADGDQLHQVLVNLVVNSRQALEDHNLSDRSIEIEVRSDEGSDRVRIFVRDNGPGIPPMIQSRIFDPFFTTKTQDLGTGIGLAVSRGLIEAHGGNLEITNPQPASGAEFVITLPVAGPQIEESIEFQPAQANGPAAEKSQLVLIVDDESEILELISDMLAGLGYRSIEAASGREAQKIVERQAPEIAAILCDVRMPDGDGPGFYSWLSEKYPHLCRRIGFVTGDMLGPSAGRFLAKSGCPVIEKPFSPGDLSAVLADLVSHSGS